MLWGLVMLCVALAGPPEVTLNGVDIRTLRDTRFKTVDVFIDADGNVHITSDRYEVQVEQGPDASGLRPPPKTASAPSAATATPAGPRVAPQPGEVTAVAAGSWWLATEDNASRGHEVRVYVNGTLVKTVQSGQPQVIEDISRYLRRGPNNVMVMSRSLSPGGGGFYVYVGRGENQGGSVTLAQPEIQHGLGASRRGDDVREYTLVID